MSPTTYRLPAPRGPLPVLYAVSGGVWTLCAATLAFVGLLQLALAAGVAPVTAPGRLHLAYLEVAAFGAVPLPLAAYLLRGALSEGRLARWGLALWNLGLLVGTVVVLAGHAAAAPWFPFPAVANLLLAAGIGAWAVAVWRGHAVGDAVPVGVVIAAPALVSGPVWLVAGGSLASPLGGAGGELAAITAARCALALWLLPLACGCAAEVLARAAGRPPYGRGILLAGVASWLALAPVAAVAAGGPDLVPPWLLPLATAAAAALALPAALLAVAVLGTWVGHRGVATPAATLAAGGALLTLAAAMASATLWSGSTALAGLAGWDPWAGLFPPFAGAWLVAVAVAVALAPPEDGAPRLVKLALAWAAAGAVPVWWMALATAAGHGQAAVLVVGAALRLPWALLGLLLAASWVPPLWTMTKAEGHGEGRGAFGLSRSVLVWTTGGAAAAVTLALTLGAFLPVADPAASRTTPSTSVRILEEGGLRIEGRGAYVAAGCPACHTQRVLPTDAALGPRTRRGDYPPGEPALAGLLRAGADLAWAGDRYPSRELMAAALAVHGPRSSGALVPMPWLFGPQPRGEGDAIVDYLLGLRAGAAP